MNKIIPAIFICIFLITSCSNPDTTNKISETGQIIEQGENIPVDFNENKSIPELKASINLALKPNEAGKIMILMYHNIGEEEKEWTRTPANFLKDMKNLYEKGYRPVSLRDYVSGNITTEQGFTPVVITFDDGNLNNFEYLDNGLISEASAVGLLINFHDEHKDFPLEATFFLDGDRPFKQGALVSKKLHFIIEKGMDIGNHTRDHLSFKSASPEEIQEQIGAQAQYLEAILSKNNYTINTLALPFGERPKDDLLTPYLAKGSYNGIAYENITVLNVGWNPAYSPYDKNFDYTSIPRIRASEMKVDNVGFYNYLEYFDKHPDKKFISDGIPGIITIPKEQKDSLNADSMKEVYSY